MTLLIGVGLYFLWVVYNCCTRAKLRVAEYDDGLFYIERRSDFIPFFWHRRIMQYHDGSIGWDWQKSESSVSELGAYQLIEKHRKYWVDRKKKTKRIRILRKSTNKSQLIEELKTASAERERELEIIELLKQK